MAAGHSRHRQHDVAHVTRICPAGVPVVYGYPVRHRPRSRCASPYASPGSGNTEVAWIGSFVWSYVALRAYPLAMMCSLSSSSVCTRVRRAGRLCSFNLFPR